MYYPHDPLFEKPVFRFLKNQVSKYKTRLFTGLELPFLVETRVSMISEIISDLGNLPVWMIKQIWNTKACFVADGLVYDQDSILRYKTIVLLDDAELIEVLPSIKNSLYRYMVCIASFTWNEALNRYETFDLINPEEN